jgi:hypothetical protein
VYGYEVEEQEEEDENEDEDEDEEKVTNQPGTARRPKQPAGRIPTEVSPPPHKKKDRILDGKRSGQGGEKRMNRSPSKIKLPEKKDTEINKPKREQNKSLPQPENKTKEKMILWACKHTPNGFIASVKILSAQPG